MEVDGEVDGECRPAAGPGGPASGAPDGQSAGALAVGQVQRDGRPAPDASMTDGLLDVGTTGWTRLLFLRSFRRVFAGTHVELPSAQVRTVRTMELVATGCAATAAARTLMLPT